MGKYLRKVVHSIVCNNSSDNSDTKDCNSLGRVAVKIDKKQEQQPPRQRLMLFS